MDNFTSFYPRILTRSLLNGQSGSLMNYSSAFVQPDQTKASQSPVLLPTPLNRAAMINRNAITSFGLAQVAAATSRYVKTGASGTGSSWSNDLVNPDRINASTSNDQVWIAVDTYKTSTAGLTKLR